MKPPSCQCFRPVRNSGRPRRRAFSLLELLVSFAVFIVLLGLVTAIMSSASGLWLRHRNQSAAFESANAAFNTLTKSLAQAVLNTYWEVQANRYGRSSELHFVMGSAAELLGSGSALVNPGDAVFFQAALGRPTSPSLKRLPQLLNGIGYFVQFDGGPPLPSFLSTLAKERYRFRLYEWLQPTENLAVYNSAGSTASAQRAWFRGDLANGSLTNAAALAENVIGLILLAEYPDSSGAIVPVFDYDSRDTTAPGTLNQLPPRIRVVMAVIDESSAARLADLHGTSPPPVQPEPAWFQNPSAFDDDLKAWENKLKAITPKIAYRIFTSTVVIQNAKWSVSP
ncbi:MAG TPA: prepilin-type N-terminal cleavage/methylation domain-containing protein [Terrimicrobiaceae bacterium]|nr:prepilin-type N-terminal cleavage/methylation domain-containing protein [Terrimicrobiaceae bacterium]